MNLRHRREIEAEAGIGGDQDGDVAGQLARQHRALDVAAGKLADGVSGGAGLDLVALDLAQRLLVKVVRLSHQPPEANGARSNSRNARLSATLMRGDAGVLQRLLGKQRQLVVAHLLAGGVIAFALR